MEPALKAHLKASSELDSVLEKLFHTCAFNAEQWPIICKTFDEKNSFTAILNHYPHCKNKRYSWNRFCVGFGTSHSKWEKIFERR
jgi:hypothetical protein